MLFDLRGRRRRAVQATYLTLAVLMGGGLVLFGIGGDVSGGLFDAFSDRSGGGQGRAASGGQVLAALSGGRGRQARRLGGARGPHGLRPGRPEPAGGGG